MPGIGFSVALSTTLPVTLKLASGVPYSTRDSFSQQKKPNKLRQPANIQFVALIILFIFNQLELIIHSVKFFSVYIPHKSSFTLPLNQFFSLWSVSVYTNCQNKKISFLEKARQKKSNVFSIAQL